jgi:transcriptional regulator with XRE-family HTH domain
MIIGDRLRETRTSRGLSLTDVATKADISAATLSRIENGKQGLDLGLFLVLAKILAIAPAELLTAPGDGGDGHDPLAGRIASLPCVERAKLWRDLTDARRSSRRKRVPSRHDESITHRLEELFAQFEMIREELDAMRSAIRRKPVAAADQSAMR